VLAPAKVNLTLEVLGTRSDGYHEIRSVMQTVSLCDTLRFSLNSGMEIRANIPDWLPERSLVSRAVEMLLKESDCHPGASIELKKSIPWLSGLGGDSSDAAATLLGLNRLWLMDLSLVKLLEMAAGLGSDVSFFLYGGTAVAEGRGELVTPLVPLPHTWFVFLMPPVSRRPGKTGQLYSNLRDKYYTAGEKTESLIAMMIGEEEMFLCLNEVGMTDVDYADFLFNTFENVAFDFFGGLWECRERFLAAGARKVHLAGSGPTLFTLIQDFGEAESIYLRLKEQGEEVHLADTRPAGKMSCL
jgi:4-diphosphocytidyl-2-C-methyl-D-erythritol kinase